jgi:3-(methylthio)propanoyl-CoA dehydrogenase
MQKQYHVATAGLADNASDAFLKAKIAACRYYLEVMVPEALSLRGSAMAGAELLYALNAEELAA